MMSEFIWNDSKDQVKIIENFGDRLPQQENGSDCGLFMLEFMFRAYHDFNKLTDFLDKDNEQTRPEELFDQNLIRKRRADYLKLVQKMSIIRGIDEADVYKQMHSIV